MTVEDKYALVEAEPEPYSDWTSPCVL